MNNNKDHEDFLDMVALGTPSVPKFSEYHLGCQHPKIEKPPFNLEIAKDMTADQIRAFYPRGCEFCPDCMSSVITYASAEHFFAGDW